MSDWKKNYLDALEVPVWVPLNDSVAEKAQVEEQNHVVKSSEPASGEQAAPSNGAVSRVEAAPGNETAPSEEPEYNTPQLKLRLLHGELKAQYGFVIDANTDLKSALVTYQQLQFAWKAWLDQPLSAALLQVIKEQDPSASPAAPAGENPQELVELNEFKGRLFDCGDLELLQADESQQHYISAPAFNFNQADKKAWWQLLQNLH